MSLLTALRAILGVILVLFIPGFGWTYAILGTTIDKVARFSLSIVFSIILVPASVLALNRVLGVPITTLSISLVALGLCISGLGISLARQRLEQSQRRSEGD